LAKNGTSFPIEYTSTPIHENGEVTGTVVVFSEITERKEKHREAREFSALYEGPSPHLRLSARISLVDVNSYACEFTYVEKSSKG